MRGQTFVEADTEIGGFTPANNDDRILHCCIIMQQIAMSKTVLLTNDRNLCVKVRPGTHAASVAPISNVPFQGGPAHLFACYRPERARGQSQTLPCDALLCFGTRTVMQYSSPIFSARLPYPPPFELQALAAEVTALEYSQFPMEDDGLARLFEAADPGNPHLRLQAGTGSRGAVVAEGHPLGMPLPRPQKAAFVPSDPEGPQTMPGQIDGYVGNAEVASGNNDEKDGAGDRVAASLIAPDGTVNLCICSRYTHLHPPHED